MTTSGIKSFTPQAQELITQAFLVAGVEPQLQKSEHDKMAKMAINLLFSEWMGQFTPEWLKVVEEISIVPGQRSYELSPGVDDVDSAVVLFQDQNDPNSTITSIMTKITSKEYNEMNYDFQGVPSQYYFERKEPPIIHLLYDPQENYTLRLVCVYRPDVVLQSNETLDIPFRWHAALTYGLAAKLSAIIPKSSPDQVILIKQQADMNLSLAIDADGDGVNPVVNSFSFQGLGGY